MDRTMRNLISLAVVITGIVMVIKGNDKYDGDPSTCMLGWIGVFLGAVNFRFK